MDSFKSFKCFIHIKSQFREKSISRKTRCFSLSNSVSSLSSDAIMLQHLIIQSPLYYLLRGRLLEDKNKRKFQTFSSKSGHGRLRDGCRLQEVPNIVINLTWKLLVLWKTVRWSRRGGRLLEFVVTGGSTVLKFKIIWLIMWIGHRKESRKLTFRALALRRSESEGLTLETSAFESLYGGQFTLSTQLIKQNYLVILPTDAAPQFL